MLAHWAGLDTVGAAAAQERAARTPLGAFASITLGALALGTVLLGFYQGPLGRWLTW